MLTSLRLLMTAAARFALLAGPTVLAFFTGGYFADARNWAGLGMWALVAVAILVRAPMPRSRGAWLALGGLGLLAAWTLASITWAPIAGDAYQAGQIAVLYVGALLASALLFTGSRRAQRVVEPALAGGALIVIGYGLSERFLPGLLNFSRSISAEGRLEQPLTYWNAMGELAALGFVLAVRVAGDATRVRGLRAVAAAAAGPLGLGLYLSFSRGALFACLAGVVTLLVAAVRTEQFRAIGIGLAAGILAAAAAAPFHGVAALGGRLATRETQGAIVLALLVLIMLIAAAVQWWIAGTETGARLRLPRRAPLIALIVICAGLALAIVAGAKEGTQRPLSGGASRYTTFQSDRYDYWRVALRAFGQEPLRGVGAGGWAVYWLKDRPINEAAQDAHSLPLQTLAELGLVGFGFLVMFLAGVVVVARTAYRRAPTLAVGPIAGVVVWVAHSPLDWDWQMPAVTLIAMILGGSLIAMAERSVGPERYEPAVERNSQEAVTVAS